MSIASTEIAGIPDFTSHPPAERRPVIENLYDVFAAIRDDEEEHVKTMVACQQSDAQLALKSPHSKLIRSA